MSYSIAAFALTPGEIPSELGGLKRLKHFALCNNRLVGKKEEGNRGGGGEGLMGIRSRRYFVRSLMVAQYRETT